MARVSFTPTLKRYISAPPVVVAGGTVRAVLSAVFKQNPELKSYILDDAGALRKHVNVFVDGEAILDRSRLSDAVLPDSEVFVLQALSGG